MRESIGKVTGPQPVPSSVNYDLWTGPAPLEPLMRKRLHYDWHWVWSTGTGELGNNGIYPLNEVRLALGQNVLPRRVLSLGGRFTFDDDGQTPNSQLALFQYDPGPLVIFELRNLPSEKGPKDDRHEDEVRTGRGCDCRSRPASLATRVVSPRTRATSTTSFPPCAAATSATCGPTSSKVTCRPRWFTWRTLLPGRHVTFGDEVRDAIKDRGSEAVETFGRFQEHLAANGVDFSKSQMMLGPWLEMDSEREEFVGDSDLRASQPALRGSYRKPFVVPEQQRTT